MRIRHALLHIPGHGILVVIITTGGQLQQIVLQHGINAAQHDVEVGARGGVGLPAGGHQGGKGLRHVGEDRGALVTQGDTLGVGGGGGASGGGGGGGGRGEAYRSGCEGAAGWSTPLRGRQTALGMW